MFSKREMQKMCLNSVEGFLQYFYSVQGRYLQQPVALFRLDLSFIPHYNEHH